MKTRVVVEIESDTSEDKVLLTVRRAEGDDARTKAALSYPLSREMARELAWDEIEKALAKPGAAVRTMPARKAAGE